MAGHGQATLMGWAKHSAQPAAAAAATAALPFPADAAVEYVRNEYFDEHNKLSELHASEWPWTLWAAALYKQHVNPDGALPNAEVVEVATAMRVAVERWAGKCTTNVVATAVLKAKPAPQPTAVEAAAAVFKAPAASTKADKRKFAKVDQPRGPAAGVEKKRTTICKTVSARKRIEEAEFLNESFIVDPNNKSMIFCQCCTGQFGTRRQILQQHRDTSKHQGNLVKWRSRASTTDALRQALADHAAAGSREAGAAAGAANASVTEETRLFRAETVQSFVQAGVPIAKIDNLRPYLEKRSKLPLTAREHLTELIPPVHSVEVEFAKQWLSGGQRVGVIFDGTTHGGELLAVVGRQINAATFLPEQRVLAFKLYEKTGMKHDEIAGALIDILLAQRGISGASVICLARDRASNNTAALEHNLFRAVFPNFIDSRCLSHTLCKPCEDISTPKLCILMSSLTVLTAKGRQSLALWKEHSGSAAPGHSNIRWGSFWEECKYFLKHWQHIEPFTRKCQADDHCRASCASILLLMDSMNAKVGSTLMLGVGMQAKLECAALTDFGAQIVPRLYMLEGDGFTFLDAFDCLMAIELYLVTPSLPECDRVIGEYVATQHTNLPEANRRAKQEELRLAMRAFCRNLIEAGKKGFQTRFGEIAHATGGQLSDLVAFFKAARLVNPFSAYSTTPMANAVEAVRAIADTFPLLGRDKARIDRLEAELPTYMAACSSLALPQKPDNLSAVQHRDTCVAQFFANNVGVVPQFCALFRDLALVTASSAAAERVFSLYNSTFNDQQESAKEDYVEASMMAQYRLREPSWGRAE